MTISFFELLQSEHRTLVIIASLITNILVFINGWTDAPNSISNAVKTRAASIPVILLSNAIANFLGAFTMLILTHEISSSVSEMIHFGTNLEVATITGIIVMIVSAFWSVFSWGKSYPVSMTHSLLSGILGASLAVSGSLSRGVSKELTKVGIGILLSFILAYFLSFLAYRILRRLAYYERAQETRPIFRQLQLITSVISAFIHGAQSSQKLTAIYMVILGLTGGFIGNVEVYLPLWFVFIVSLSIALGTGVGGLRIVRRITSNLLPLSAAQGLSSEIGNALTLGIITFLGIPVSTSQSKVMSFVGVGVSKRKSSVRKNVFLRILKYWILTVLVCFVFSYILVKVLL
ncbi:inorganic phosphate transporter [Guggenheimella bovis]